MTSAVRLKRVQHRDPEPSDVRFVAGHQREVVGLGRGGQQRVDDRHGTDRVHAPPFLGNGGVDGQDPVAEAREDVGEPRLEHFGLPRCSVPAFGGAG